MSLNDSALSTFDFWSSSTGTTAAKRMLDGLTALVLLTVLSPLLVAATVLILVSDRQSPFYLDERVGRRGRLFKCWKFRTMRSEPGLLERYLAANPDEAEQYRVSRKLRHDPRITPLGVLLRRSSIDELPQLWNVLRGEMSLVGPRPITEREFTARPAVDQSWMASVRPGMTGLWQVSGRCELDDARRIELDTRYAREWSLGMDLAILLRTPLAVTGTRGAR